VLATKETALASFDLANPVWSIGWCIMVVQGHQNWYRSKAHMQYNML